MSLSHSLDCGQHGYFKNCQFWEAYWLYFSYYTELNTLLPQALLALMYPMQASYFDSLDGPTLEEACPAPSLLAWLCPFDQSQNAIVVRKLPILACAVTLQAPRHPSCPLVSQHAVSVWTEIALFSDQNLHPIFSMPHWGCPYCWRSDLQTRRYNGPISPQEPLLNLLSSCPLPWQTQSLNRLWYSVS